MNRTRLRQVLTLSHFHSYNATLVASAAAVVVISQ